MKLDARRVAAFLRDPGACRVILLYGDDNGLIRERGEALTRVVAGSVNDPFRVADLERDSMLRITEELAARPLTGGRRVVRVRDITDAASGAVVFALKSLAEGLLILEAGELPGRSKLRSVIEAASDAVAIACYGEQGAELGQSIAAALNGAGFTVDAEARTYLTDHLGTDRGSTRQELEKLALYCHGGSTVDLEAAMTMVGDMAGLQLDDALHAALEGDVATADRALTLAMEEGASPISVLRSTLIQLQRLGRVHAMMRSGQAASDAVKSLRPPIFFRRAAGLARAAERWSPAALAAVSSAAWKAERDCKRTGAPAVTLARQTVLTIARRGSRQACR